MKRTSIRLLAAFALLGAGYAMGSRTSATASAAELVAQQQAAEQRVFEIRTYTSTPGRLADVLARFRDHATYLFDKHGMKNVAYFVPVDSPQSLNTLVYVIAHPSREAAARHWNEFQADSAWLRARAASEVNGPILVGIQSLFVKATDFSPIQ